MGMSTEKWLSIEPVRIDIRELIPTQDVKPEWVEAKKYNPMSSYCGDPYPHVVKYDGKLYISDGHHRIASWLLSSKRMRWVRIYDPAI
jgi:hypothetical protein